MRHNLSINPHFRKGNKAPQGAGHLWIISSRDSEANLLAWEHVNIIGHTFSCTCKIHSTAFSRAVGAQHTHTTTNQLSLIAYNLINNRCLSTFVLWFSLLPPPPPSLLLLLLLLSCTSGPCRLEKATAGAVFQNGENI